MTFSRPVVFSLLFLLATKESSYSQCNATSSTSTVNICSASLPYVWNHISYSEAGSYLVMLTNRAGCDSFANLNLQVNSVSSSGNIDACLLDFPLSWHNKTLPAPGIYLDTTLNYLGCDSIIVLNLAATNVWTGGSSNNWEDANNWTCHVLPNVATDVIINSGTVILNSNQTVRSLTVTPGATFTVTPGFDLHITSAPLTSAPLYLTKYIGHLGDDSTYFGYIEKHYFYDSLKRLQSVVTNVFQFPFGIGEPHADFGYPDSLIYYYNAGDSLPYKAAHYNAGLYDPAEYYTYDNQTRVNRIIYLREGSRLRYDYTYSASEIVIADTFGNVKHLVYDGNNVTYDHWGGNLSGFIMEHNNLADPFSFVPVNRHIPYSEGWISRGETYFNKTAVSQTTAPGYQVIYEYDGIINNVPARAKLTKSEYGGTSKLFQYFYYGH